MLKRELGFRKVPHSILLFFSLLILAETIGSANGSVQRTYYASEYNIFNGTYLSGSIPASAQTVDSDYLVIGNVVSDTTASTHYPSGYTEGGSTTWISGGLSNLTSNDSVHMTFRSYFTITPGSTTYNLTGITSPSSTHIAYGYEIDQTTDPASNTIPSIEVSTAEYTQLSASDDSRIALPDPRLGDNAAMLYKVKIAEEPDGIIEISCLWEGYVAVADATNPVRFLIWNYVAGAYELLQEGTGTADFTLSGSKTSNNADYIDDVGYITLLIWNKDTSEPMWIDYVEVDVTFGQYTIEVEFTGSSNTYTWTQLEWTIDNAWTIDSVSVTMQLYNYSLGDYPVSGNGYMNYTSNAIANTEETKNQTVTVNPANFRNATGYWKLKVKGEKAIETQFDLKADWIEFKPYYNEYTVSTEFLFSGMTTDIPIQLNFTAVSQYNISSVRVTVQVWNYSSSTYATSGEGYLTRTSLGSNETQTLSINTNPQFYTSNGTAKIEVTGVLATPSQFQQEINQVQLLYSTQTSFDWFTALLYVLPLVFVLLFLLARKLRRKQTTVSRKPIEPPEGSFEETKPKRLHITKKTDAFSQQFGMTHQQMKGEKMLLEIDPTSDYHKALSNFVSETKHNNELLFILTNRNSTIHTAFSGASNVKFLLLTSKTSSPQQINENETLLPASDLSVLLDAYVRIQKVKTEKTINVLFDNLSDIILRCGFEKTYRFIRFLLEAISPRKTTALFLSNAMAHEPVISASIRGLFQNQLAYAKSGPKVGTL